MTFGEAIESYRQLWEANPALKPSATWCSRDGAELVRFLALGGFRKGEAAHITWGDCDLDQQ